MKHARTLFRGIVAATDLDRWRNQSELLPEWDERTKLLADLVPEGARVIEFGAGRRQMERMLQHARSYVPSDVIDRGPGTWIIDLNQRPLPDLQQLNVDTAVFGGVLEYVQNLPAVVSWLAGQVSSCIASYECARSTRGTWRRFPETVQRARIGWVNTFNEVEFLKLFEDTGFRLRDKRVWHTKDGDEPLFFFSRECDSSP
jgi:hypothetical protein